MDEAQRVAPVEQIPSESTLLATARADGEEVELIFTRLGDGEVVAFENFCPHWADVSLDKGSGAAVRDGQLLCQKHGATFERETGYCDFGPCEGASLSTVDVAVEGGAVYLTDGYEFLKLGGTDRDDDPSTGSRIGFGGV